MTPRRLLMLLPASAVAVAMLGCGGAPGDAHLQRPGPGGAGDEAEQKAIAVAVTPITRGEIASLYSTSATLRADRRATVIARTRGVVRRLVVEEGDRVAAEEPMAHLEDDEQRIAAARARSTSDNAEREVERLRGLYESGLVSEDEYEDARRDADDARHALELAELELSRTVIRAPFAGLVLERQLDVGATVADGTAVFELADLDPLYADINIPERHVTALAPGQAVRLSADSTGDRAAATIERIAPMVDTATGTVKVTVAVEASAALRPGAFVRVDIVTATHPDALVVPRSAVVAEGRRWQLYRLAGDDTVEQIEVELGFENGTRVEIARAVETQTELSPGMQVVSTGAPALSDGARVQVITDEPATADAADAS